MKDAILEEFKNYSYFSVRVDRFFNVTNIYGIHHDALKFMYQSIPDPGITETALANNHLAEEVKMFLLIAVNNLDYMGTTNIFSGGGSIDPEKIPEDIKNFSFYTCYCFQWTLFENFIKKMIFILIEDKLLPYAVVRDLEKLSYKTKQFLDYINTDKVFDKSPFITVLPVPGWVPKFETCDYSELDKIRELRNSFIHGIETPEITPEHITIKQRNYERSMWILRKFAENVWQEVLRMKNK